MQRAGGRRQRKEVDCVRFEPLYDVLSDFRSDTQFVDLEKIDWDETAPF